MFDELLKTLIANIVTVRAILQTNNSLRLIVFRKESAIDDKLAENTEFIALIDRVPGEIEWQIYDHCAAVMRLYAIYERFVEDLISDWLLLIPEIVSCYSDLEEKIQNTHREGIGRLLVDKNKNRFQHLSIEKVVQGLFNGITGAGKYELLPEAFLLHEQNLRKEVLAKLFADAGIKNAWEWVKNHREINNFVEEVRGSQNTAEAELKQLIDYRNEAAHGVVDQILGTQELLDLGDFVEALCKSLSELVTYHVILRQTAIGKAREIGKITEWFKQPKAAVAKVNKVTLTLDTSLFLILVNEESSYCYLAKIISIRINDIQKDNVEITDETEVGLKFDIDPKKGMSLYVVD